ncbi:unnamed protein product [Gongylonema pulchrum]|uniref:PCI domain-containing protein n=1 Tax=Gongylonema pulchrum TaxID=637853 RepID=A0A183D505_9BILA|nr:unnamed protein product [Gongylonema pulchrum]
MEQKLRQLTLVTMAKASKIIPVEAAMRELHITDLQEFQRLFISALYDGIIQGRLNAQKGVIEVFSWKNRDVSDEELEELSRRLDEWIEQCKKTKEGLNQVKEEVEKVQKMIEEEEERRVQKEACRRSKNIRGKKQC